MLLFLWLSAKEFFNPAVQIHKTLGYNRMARPLLSSPDKDLYDMYLKSVLRRFSAALLIRGVQITP